MTIRRHFLAVTGFALLAGMGGWAVAQQPLAGKLVLGQAFGQVHGCPCAKGETGRVHGGCFIKL